MLARERVANVRKHWVRLVTACNSRCVFCLDTDTPRGVYLPEDEVQRELIRGRQEAQRGQGDPLGGEGSIHPKFVDFIRFAKDLGLRPHPDRHQRRDALQEGILHAAVEAGPRARSPTACTATRRSCTIADRDAGRLSTS
jgi:hypothetical protein